MQNTSMLKLTNHKYCYNELFYSKANETTSGQANKASTTEPEN